MCMLSCEPLYNISKRLATLLGSEELWTETTKLSILTLQWLPHWSQRASDFIEYHISSIDELPHDILEKNTWNPLK